MANAALHVSDVDRPQTAGMARAMPRLAPRGLIVADNALADGAVIEGTPAIARFNEHVAADPRSIQALLTVRDGLTLIRRA